MMTTNPEKIQVLKEIISSGDKIHTLELLEDLYTELTTNAELINWIIIPANLTSVQDLIIENFEIPRKAMMVKNRVHDRKRRALMFTQAMRVAVTRSING